MIPLRIYLLTLVPEVFFSLGATELSGEAAIASREAARKKPVSRRSAPLTLTFLAAGEREDLWHPGYYLLYLQTVLIIAGPGVTK